MDSYTFAIPEEDYHQWYLGYPSYTELEPGQTLTISGSCNPNFGGPEDPFSCKLLEEHAYICNWWINSLVKHGLYNENGHLETFLQCPQCGCGAESAANLNDLYAAEQAGSRKVSEIEPDTFFKQIMN